MASFLGQSAIGRGLDANNSSTRGRMLPIRWGREAKPKESSIEPATAAAVPALTGFPRGEEGEAIGLDSQA
jgi:hypothetical protein